MWNLERLNLAEIPPLYTNESILLREQVVNAHFFIGGCDWYAVEFDGKDIFFGYAILNGDYQNAEWGYFSLSEMKAINIGGMEIDCDLYWKKRSACEVNKIVKGCRWEV
jgi:hypothetical protein